MTSKLFDRLKKLAKREGKIIFADNSDVFVILPLDEYEMLAGDFCDEDCECEDENCDCRHSHDFDDDFDFGEEIFANNEEEKKGDDETDKDLIKRVNEDIAKWREEQKRHDDDNHNNDIKKTEIAVDLKPEQKKEDVLTEEERYYLEPLE